MPRPIAERILDCFPAGVYALHGLLRLLDVVETEEVPTAAVECAAEPRLLVNPAFVGRHANTPEKLLMLVMHELHHVLLGHTRLFPRVTAVDNLVFDAVINALLCRMFPAAEHTSFLTDYYSDMRFPECLLRPVTGWPIDPPPGRTPRKKVFLPPALHTPELRPAADVYLALYSPRGAGYEELYAVLGRQVSEETASAVPLLGDHPGPDEGLEARSPVLFDAVRQIVERWPQPPDPIAGRSLASVLKSSEVSPEFVPDNRAVLGRLLRRVAGCEGSWGPARRRGEEERAVLTPVPGFDRRAVVQCALGVTPLLYSAPLAQPRPRPAGERVHVYLDVSGSIAGLRGKLYPAVLDCRGLVHEAVHLFSTEVVDVSLEELRRGRCASTDGTDAGCVARHMRAHGVRRAVLLTDGYVGAPAGSDRETLSRSVLGVALTPGNSSRADLEGLADHWAQLA